MTTTAAPEATTAPEARMNNVVMVVPEAYKALVSLSASAKELGLPHSTALLVQTRASQINGCSLCVELHAGEMKRAGESDERIWAVAAWRESPHYTEAERAALALTEAVTRIADSGDPVLDEIWDEAARHFDEQQLSALLLEIGAINVWNRLNVATRQPAGQGW